MCKRSVSAVLAILVLLLVSSVALASNYRFIEADKKDGTYPALKGANGDFSIRSPYRGTPVSTNSWVNITGMYNEPRSGYIHVGVDIGGVDDRDIYPVHADSTEDDATVLGKGFDTTYGNYVWLRHVDKVNGTNYYYDSFYAHMKYASPVSIGQVVAYDTKLGDTGTTGQSEGVHLHLEFRTRVAQDSSGQPRRWAPATFYWKINNTWALDTSFITRLADSGATVRFRCRAKHSDGYYNATGVRLYYKIGSTGTWSNVAMNVENVTDQVYSKDLSALAPAGSDVYFYVKATETKYNRTAYRPWLHSDYTTPAEEPFLKSI